MTPPKLGTFQIRAYLWLGLSLVATFYDFKAIIWWLHFNLARHHRPWIVKLPEPIAIACLLVVGFSPLIAVCFYVNRLSKKMLGPTYLKDRETLKRRQLETDRNALGWEIPRSFDMADVPKCLVIISVFTLFIFVVVLLISGFAHYEGDVSVPTIRAVFKTAFAGAGLCGGTMLLVTGALLFGPRPRAAFADDGFVERRGTLRKLIPYDAIHAVEITQSPKVPALSCFLVLHKLDRGHRGLRTFTFGSNAPLGQFIAAFKIRGIEVEDLRPHHPRSELHQ